MKLFFNAVSRQILLLCLFSTVLLQCKKDALTPNNERINSNDSWSISQEKFDELYNGIKDNTDRLFFDLNYASTTNPNIKPEALGRDKNEEALRSLCGLLIAQNQQHHYAPSLIQRIGFPIWNRSMVLPNQGYGNEPVIFLPFAHNNADSVEAFLTAAPFPDFWNIQLTYRSQIDSIIQSQQSISNEIRFSLAVLYHLDKAVFGRIDSSYLQIIDDDGFHEPIANDRCEGYYQTVWVCVPCMYTFSGGSEDRCENCVDIVACVLSGYTDSSSPTWAGVGGNGSSTNLYGDNGGQYVGSNNPTNGGGVSAGFMSMWQSYIGMLEPDGGSQQSGNLTPGQIENLNTVYELYESGLFSYNQLETAYNNIQLAQEVVDYLQDHPNDPNAQQVASTILNIVASGNMNQSQAISLLQLAETIKLTPEQLNWLGLPENHQAFNQMNNFVIQNPGAEFLIEGMQAHLDMMMNNISDYFSNNNQNNYPAIGTEAWAYTLKMDDNSDDVIEPGPNAEELFLSSLNPGIAIVVFRNRNVAFRATQTIWAGSGQSFGNGRPDAFRHGFWMAMNARTIGNLMAWLFGEAHESETEPQFEIESTMDRFNNGVGIQIGGNNRTATDQTLSDMVMARLLIGEMRYLAPLDFAHYDHGIIPGVTQLISTNQ